MEVWSIQDAERPAACVAATAGPQRPLRLKRSAPEEVVLKIWRHPATAGECTATAQEGPEATGLICSDRYNSCNDRYTNGQKLRATHSDRWPRCSGPLWKRGAWFDLDFLQILPKLANLFLISIGFEILPIYTPSNLFI